MATRNKADHYWYARNPSKIRRKTAHLSLMEKGAYSDLLDWYYENRKPLPQEWVQMHRICGAVAPDEQAAVQTVVRQFFTLEESGWHNRTADEEIAKAQGLSQKRRDAQAEREKKRLEKGSKKGANAPAKAPANVPTITITTTDSISNDIESPHTPKGGDGVPSSFLMPDGTFLSFDQLFERYWSNYPNVRDKGHKGKAKDELFKKLKEGIEYETIGRGITKYRKYCDSTGEKQPDMFRWVRDKGWERDYAISAAAPTTTGRSAGHSLENAVSQALADKTRRPEGRAERLKNLGLDDDSGNV